ncbi:DUF4954 family protein [Prolixibacteraceae bacterium JC049]|nr:DUF4954 family protein [Prolixibacteraceae bacterium JC049]
MNAEIPQTIYRKLTSEEIGQLIMQNCESDDWNLVEVTDGFDPIKVKNAKFTGHIKIGRFDEKAKLFGGISYHTGIYNAWLHNCTIGDNVLIHNVRSYIANYEIGARTIIHNITTLAVDGTTTFGNGTKVEAINEGGGREVPIYDHLSTHVAYIMSLYRHLPKVIDALFKMVDDYVGYIKSNTGTIGPNSQILNCDNIINVKTGPSTHIDGARKLSNGSINSTYEAPIKIGASVIMEDFIVCSGSQVTDATLVSKCFIGQGCILDKHYSAVDSLFFANCQGFHGEACSIFAGPYTVTHHKSTLLIAGMFSFMNAGSGSNQSNHMYKLGPIHQGIVERGSKTTSDSYVLWPSHIGAFSLVMGRHYKHSDTSNFPFSYLIESKDESILVPAINLKSIGTIRDTQKWPKRDKRTDSKLLDHINYNLLSPYTIQKVLKGHSILKDIQKASGKNSSSYSYEGMKIRKSALEKGIQLYEMVIWKFIGNSIITRLHDQHYNDNSEIREALQKDTPIGKGKWIDLSGMLCPAEALDQLLSSIESGQTTTLEAVDTTLRSLHKNYYTFEWTWVYDEIETFYKKPINQFTANDIISIINKWKESVLGIDQMLYEDARKEFSLGKMTGFGIDGENGSKERDFESVRGDFETNETVIAIRKHMKDKEELGNILIQKMENTIRLRQLSN